MTTEKEAEVASTVEQPPPATEEAKPAETKPVKEKKTRAPREKKPKQPKTASHPPYFQMIKEALLALNEKSGSSPYAIAKYMEEKHKAVLPANFKKILALQLKNSAARGKLTKIRASYKLSAGKKEKDTTTKEVSKSTKTTNKENNKPKTATTRKTRSVNKTVEAAKKPAKRAVGAKKTKKSTPAKPKQPKSIKSPTAKRTKKAAVATASS
ncbi:hypothetical protein JCGZ_06500 [Jatropha curcas]|uniref:H15 domain-containing protein n=1 Tax=Jatropha curcas TaxID=180498 RepID=A0A067LEC1_JATCU|nr:histone H1 [Jatropha curcas]KDP46712.1 hypothetical protein JCGZ_06500 [Jatropha curcas]